MLKLDKESEEEFRINKEMEVVLSSLANEDALKIFQEAKEGITNSTRAIKKLGLTQKRYYTRLKPLLELELIEKTENGYKLTFLGKIIYEILCRKLEKTLKNKDRLALIDRLNKAELLSKEEKEKIASTISIKENIIGYSDIFSEIKPVEIIRSYEEFVNLGIDLLEKAEEEILFAARFSDVNFSEPFLRAFERGIKIFVLDGDQRNFSKRLNMFRLLLTDSGTIKVLHELFNSPNVRFRYVDLSFSFAVIDREHTIFEVTNPIDRSFLCGFLFHNKEISEIFAKIFYKLYEKGEKNPFTEFLKRIDSV